MAQKSCLITGGTGFFGIHAAKKFLSHGYKVHLLDIAPLDEPKLKVRVVYHKGDVRDKGLLTKLCKGKDVVVHAAAALPIQRSIEVIKGVNVDGTRNVLEACRINKVPRVVFISTTAVYGVPKFHPIFETSPLNPLGPYGETKAEAEKICEAYRKKGLFVSVLRPKTFLGPERLGVFQILFDWIRRGKKIYIIGNGENKYQLLAVQDLAEAVWIASNNLKLTTSLTSGRKSSGL